jgi:hypothetical protein
MTRLVALISQGIHNPPISVKSSSVPVPLKNPEQPVAVLPSDGLHLLASTATMDSQKHKKFSRP